MQEQGRKSRLEGPRVIEVFPLEPQKAKETLEVSAKILKELGLKFWLDTGTLLGAVRDGGFIEGDFDIDFGLFLGGVRVEELRDALERAGFEVIWFMRVGGLVSPQLAALYKGIRVDFSAYERSRAKGQVWHISYVPLVKVALNIFPAYLFKKFENVGLAGELYLAPSPVEAYLRWRYGDWKERQKEWDYMKDPPCVAKVCPWEEIDFRGYV